MKIRSLLLAFVLLLILSIPVMAQDATVEVTENPIEIVSTPAPVEGSGNDTVINVGTPVETTETPTETPAEPMPWWAQAGLTIAGLVTIYVTLTMVVREAVKAFMSRPTSVASAENTVNLIRSLLPDVLEEAAAKGAKQAQEATRETVEELRKAFAELVDGIPASSKPRTATTTDTTPGGYTQTTPPMP